MTNWYPEDFPEASRARVLAEEIQGGRDFDAAKRQAPYFADVEALLRAYVLRVFLAFAREASTLVPAGIWSIDQLEAESMEFLRRFTIAARHERGYTKSGHQISAMVNNWNGGLLEKVRQAYRTSSEWQQYEDILLAAASAPRAPKTAPIEPLQASQTEPVNWKDVEINFISDERVQVQARGRRQTYNYAEMGFEDKRKGTPSRGWALLRELAKQDGQLRRPHRNSQGFLAWERAMQRASKTLREHFRLTSDPIVCEDGEYRCRFKLRCRPSSQT